MRTTRRNVERKLKKIFKSVRMQNAMYFFDEEQRIVARYDDTGVLQLVVETPYGKAFFILASELKRKYSEYVNISEVVFLSDKYFRTVKNRDLESVTDAFIDQNDTSAIGKSDSNEAGIWIQIPVMSIDETINRPDEFSGIKVHIVSSRNKPLKNI